MADFTIQSLRGGLCEDPPTSIADDQCTVARNVEFWLSMLGERRLGSQQIAITGPLSSCARILWLHRHLPTTNPADAQLWALGVTGVPQTFVLAYKDTTWHQVAMPDPMTLDVDQFYVQGQTLHGKLFIAYKSTVNRLHVWDNGATALRRTGLAQAGGVGWVEFGTGTFIGRRYYRARWIVMAGATVLRRGEPGAGQPADPTTGIQGHRVSQPGAGITEGETHWELEASLNNIDFYRIGTAALGATIDDTTPYAQGYAQTFPLSEESGAYTVIPSVRFLTVEQDRLMGGGSFSDPAQASAVLWTPVYGDPTGVANDERIPVATSNSLSLDNYEGGPLTGLSATTNGYVYATKWSHTYQLTRSGLRAHAYEAVPLTKQRGALPGSLIEGLDQTGNPTPFLLDPDVGPCRIGVGGVVPCGADIRVTWDTVNLDAEIPARAVYFNEKKQVQWFVATAGANEPNTRLVLHTQEMRPTPDGYRRGWAIWDGQSAAAFSVCMFADNIDANGPRSNVLVPFIAAGFAAGLIWRSDTGTTDNGNTYAAEVRSKPYVHGSLLNDFECKSGALLARAATGGVLVVTLTGNFGLVTKPVTVHLDPVGSEPRVTKRLDDLGLAELQTLQVRFADPPTAGAQWALEAFAMREEKGLRA